MAVATLLAAMWQLRHAPPTTGVDANGVPLWCRLVIPPDYASLARAARYRVHAPIPVVPIERAQEPVPAALAAVRAFYDDRRERLAVGLSAVTIAALAAYWVALTWAVVR